MEPREEYLVRELAQIDPAKSPSVEQMVHYFQMAHELRDIQCVKLGLCGPRRNRCAALSS